MGIEPNAEWVTEASDTLDQRVREMIGTGLSTGGCAQSTLLGN